MPDFTTTNVVNTNKYIAYNEGGAVKLLDTENGVITSYSTLGPAIDAVLANTNNPSVTIKSGWYDLASGFTGWNVVSKTNVKCDSLVIINVPENFTGSVWNLVPNNAVLYYVTIDGGYYDEQGTGPDFAWICVNIGPTGTTGAVHDCSFKNMEVWRANAAIWMHTTGTTWANENYFTTIQATACKYLVYMEHASTYTLNMSGSNSNHFLNCAFQTTGADGTNHYPQALGGIVGVIGQWNQFTKCSIWDLAAANSSAAPMSIGSNANSTLVIGGLCTYGANFVDNGTNTTIIDDSRGIYTKNRFIINRNAGSSLDESLFNLSVSDASGDSFELANSSSTNGVFCPFFRSTQTSSAASAGLVGMYFETIVKAANDTAGGVACNVISAKRDSNVNLTDRAIFGVYNKWDPIYQFFPTYSDFTGKGIQNAVLNGIAWSAVTKSGNATLTDTELIVSVSASGANRTMTLPASSGRTGKIYLIQKSDSSTNTVTIDPNSSETINGASTLVLTQQYQTVMIWCDGSNWFTQPSNPERVGKALANGTGAQTVFTIAHGLGSTPSYASVDCSSHAIARTFTADGTNITVTFSSAPSSGTNNVVIYWRVVA